MPKSVYLLTVQEALTRSTTSWSDQIWAKYDQLDSGEFGAVGTPAFNAEWLIYLLVSTNFVKN